MNPMGSMIALIPRPDKLRRLWSWRLSRCLWNDFHPPEHIESGLSEPGIQVVYHDRCKSCPLGLAVKMADSKILFHNVAHFGDLLVALDFQLRELGGGRVLAHDAIGDFVI